MIVIVIIIIVIIIIVIVVVVVLALYTMYNLLDSYKIADVWFSADGGQQQQQKYL